MVTRESEWDDDQRAYALGILEYESLLCPNCHTHFSHAADPTVSRRVQREKRTVCLDCKAKSDLYDVNHRGHGEKCDCDEHVMWVDRRDPLPVKG